jgi:ribosome-associated protein
MGERRPLLRACPEDHVPAQNDAISFAVEAADAADDKKATDLTILDVADVLAVVDLFLLATTSSDRQLKAVVEAIEERARDQGRKPLRREGKAESGWLLIDFGDVVCHVFSHEQRDFYSLERLWADAPRIDPATGQRLAPVAPGLTAGER